MQAVGLVAIVSNLFGYTAIATVSSGDAYGTSGISAVAESADLAQVDILTAVTFFRGSTYEYSHQIIAQLNSSGARIMVIFANSADAGRIMRLAYELGVGGDGYMWIGSDSVCTEDTWLLDDGGMAQSIALRERVRVPESPQKTRDLMRVAPSSPLTPLTLPLLVLA